MTQPINRETAIALAKEAGMAGMLTDVVCSFEEIHRLCNLAVAHSRKDAEAVNDDLAADIEFIDARYRGDPSYEHDAYYMRKAAADRIRNGYKLYTHPPEADKLLQQALELFESSDSKLPAIAVKIRTYLENKT